MGFDGPGSYEIVPMLAASLSANSWEGKMEPGAPVKTYPRERNKPSDNAVWVIAQAGVNSDNGMPEYIILNKRTGYPLTATEDKGIISTPQISPADPSARWTIKSTPTHNNNVYTIDCKIESRGQLNLARSETESGTEILAWPACDDDNTRWFLDPVSE